MQPWLAPPREGLTEAEVRAAVTLEGAPKVRHGVDVLDSSDEPTGEVLQVESGSVSWSYRPPDRVTGQSTEVSDVRRQAHLTVVAPLPARTYIRRTSGEVVFLTTEDGEILTTEDDIPLTTDGSSEGEAETVTGPAQMLPPLALRRYRIWTEWLAPTGTWVRFHLGVFIPTSPPADDDGIVVRYPLTLADKSYRWKTTFLTDTLTVAAGTNPVTWVKDDLESRFGETKFSISGTEVTLTDAMVFEVGTSLLAVYNSLLTAAAFDDLTTDENGRPAAVDLAFLAGAGPEHEYGPAAGKIVTAGSVEPLLPSLPNVVRFVARQGPSLPEVGNGIVIKKNQSTGPASIDQRGEEVELRVDVDAEDQAELEAIADADAQRYMAGGGLRFVGNVGLNPRHGDRDVVTLTKPRLGLAGTWLVTSWTYPLEPFTGESAVLMPMTFERKVVVS